MGRLYGSAGSVVVWLGPADPNIHLAVSWAQTYIAKKYTAASAYWAKLDAIAKFSESARFKKGRACLQALEGYLDLLGLPYWNRMWTFQEFSLPKDEPICYCGDVAFKATMVQEAQSAILQDGIGFLDQLVETSAQEWSKLSEEEKEERGKIKSRIESKCQVVLGNMLPPLEKMRNDWRGAESPLLYLIGATAERNCYDKKDKVYALYGMVPSVQQVYPPDYAKPVKDVMLETTAYMINHEQAPAIWSFFELRADRLTDTSYPSWVPDFGLVNSRLPSGGKGVADSLLRSEDVPSAKVTSDLATAHLWARSLGTCKIVLTFDSVFTDAFVNQLRGLLQKGPSEVLESDAGKSIRKLDTLVPRMARAFVAHHVQQHQYSTEEILATFDLIFDFKTPTRPIGNHCWAMIEDAAEGLTGKTLFVTEGGCFGICVGDVKDGDMVTIPPQTRAPRGKSIPKRADWNTTGWWELHMSMV
ncbi:hypothetical protein GGR53DRAFT_487648 [Hypoxylon sp. FL1150]|nr:hypothetical protein GGR53DRAFT_487648 [Hypoxylon sp. FL1150]